MRTTSAFRVVLPVIALMVLAACGGKDDPKPPADLSAGAKAAADGVASARKRCQEKWKPILASASTSGTSGGGTFAAIMATMAAGSGGGGTVPVSGADAATTAQVQRAYNEAFQSCEQEFTQALLAMKAAEEKTTTPATLNPTGAGPTPTPCADPLSCGVAINGSGRDYLLKKFLYEVSQLGGALGWTPAQMAQFAASAQGAALGGAFSRFGVTGVDIQDLLRVGSGGRAVVADGLPGNGTVTGTATGSATGTANTNNVTAPLNITGGTGSSTNNGAISFGRASVNEGARSAQMAEISNLGLSASEEEKEFYRRRRLSSKTN